MSPARRPPLLAALLLAACSEASGPAKRPVTAAPRGSIVLVTLDTMRADHLGCYGYFRDTSPNLDRFAEQAVLFENAATTIATTLPAHVSLFASLHPAQSGVIDNDVRFETPEEEGPVLLAQALREIGFATAAFVSATPVKRESGLGVGFDVFDQPEGQQRSAWDTTQRVLRWLDAGPTEPFFLWIHYFDPHTPRAPPGEYDRFLADEALLQHLLELGYSQPIPRGYIDANNDYDGEVLYLDAQIGRLLERLRARPGWDADTVLFVGDHGEGLGQHNFLKHGEIWNEQLFVPLIVKFPEALGWNGQRRAYLVSILDVVPTVIDGLGLPVAAGFLARLEGRNAMATGFRREFVVAQRRLVEERESRRKHWNEGQTHCILDLEWKLNLALERARLYDMRSDRHETKNVFAAEPATAERLEALLTRELERFAARETPLRVGEVSPETLEDLRKLGYLR